MKKIVITVAVLASALVAQAGIIFQDDFSGLAANSLNGTTPDISTSGASWETGTGWNADGGVGTQTGLAAHLALNIEDGKVYTAEATIANASVAWLGFGFTTGTVDFTGDDDVNTRHVGNASGFMWAFNRNDPSNPDQNIFGGLKNGLNQAGLGNITADIVDGTQPVTIKIVLDNTGATSIGTFSFNGTEWGSVDYGSKLTSTTGGIGFSKNDATVTGSISNFSVDVIPEPATLGLVTAFGGGLLLIRRRFMI